MRIRKEMKVKKLKKYKTTCKKKTENPHGKTVENQTSWKFLKDVVYKLFHTKLEIKNNKKKIVYVWPNRLYPSSLTLGLFRLCGK